MTNEFIMEMVKDCCDYVRWEILEDYFKYMRSSGKTLKEIHEDATWSLYKNYNYSPGDIDDFLCILEEFQEYNYSCIDFIDCGAQQVVIGLHNENFVIKFSHEDLGVVYENLFLELHSYERKFFANLNYIGHYKGFYVYTQERVEYIGGNYDDEAEKENFDNVNKFIDYAEDTMVQFELRNPEVYRTIDSELLYYLLYRELDYSDAAYADFLQRLNGTGAHDLHDGNWGVTVNGEIKIFDPIYIG